MLLDDKFSEFLKCISVHYIWDKRHVRHSMVGNILLKFILKINFIPCHTQELFIIISNVQKKTCSPWWKERKSFYLKLFMHNLSSSLSSHNWTNIYEKRNFSLLFSLHNNHHNGVWYRRWNLLRNLQSLFLLLVGGKEEINLT